MGGGFVDGLQGQPTGEVEIGGVSGAPPHVHEGLEFALEVVNGHPVGELAPIVGGHAEQVVSSVSGNQSFIQDGAVLPCGSGEVRIQGGQGSFVLLDASAGQ